MNKHCDSIEMNIFLDLIKELKINKTTARDILNISRPQFYNWEKKGRMPMKYYWSFQNSMTVFFEKQKLRKMAKLGIIDKEFLKELIDK